MNPFSKILCWMAIELHATDRPVGSGYEAEAGEEEGKKTVGRGSTARHFLRSQTNNGNARKQTLKISKTGFSKLALGGVACWLTDLTTVSV